MYNEPGRDEKALKISSPAFEQGGNIPELYSCNGKDYSPPLEWLNVPPEAETLALIMDDPDAPGGTFVHWVVYDMPSQVTKLEQDRPAGPNLPEGGTQGANNFGNTGYGGPCPPSGSHRYFFKLYALDSRLNLDPGATKDQLEQAMEGHILDKAELMANFP
jgi:hypothetical protein